MKNHFKILALSLLLSGCSALTNKFTDNEWDFMIKDNPLIIPPDLINDNTDPLICSSEYPKLCDGWLSDKPIDEQ